jgi:hypothetical protein
VLVILSKNANETLISSGSVEMTGFVATISTPTNLRGLNLGVALVNIAEIV